MRRVRSVDVTATVALIAQILSGRELERLIPLVPRRLGKLLGVHWVVCVVGDVPAAGTVASWGKCPLTASELASWPEEGLAALGGFFHPLSSGSGTLGWLMVGPSRNGILSTEDRSVVSGIAAALATAIEKDLLVRSLKAHSRILRKAKPAEPAVALMILNDPAAVDYVHQLVNAGRSRPMAADVGVAMLDAGQRKAAQNLLSARELQTLALIAEGRTSREVAAALSRSVKTIDAYVSAIRRKLGAASRTQAVATASRLGLL